MACFKNMNYCMFGLGLCDVEHEHHDSMGGYFDECFEALGGKRAKEIGAGDDIEGGYNKWTEEL